MQAEVNGKPIELSEAGWVENLEEWTPALAEQIAITENVGELNQAHWDIINEVRTYFHDNGSVCEPRNFTKLMKKEYGKDRSSQKYIYSLFPTGLVKCANKIAGLPKPKGCS